MMMLKARQALTQRAKLDEKRALEAGDRVEKELKKLFRNYRNELKAFLRDPKSFSKSEKFDLAVVTKTINQLESILTRAGRDDVIGAIADELPDLQKSAREHFKQFGKLPKMGGTSEEALDAYMEYSYNYIDQTLDRALADPVREALFHGVFGNRSREDGIENILSITDELTENQVVTLVDDTFRQFQRAVTNETAKELELDIFWFQGPDDERTSEQCEYILNESPHGVPGMWYRDEITVDMVPGITLDNDPLVAGGHFNCRHKFYPITEDFAKEQGFELQREAA